MSTESLGLCSAADPLAAAAMLMVLLASWFHWVTALGPVTATWTGAPVGLPSPSPPPQAGTMDMMTVSMAALTSVRWLGFIPWLSKVGRHGLPPVHTRSARVNNHDR